LKAPHLCRELLAALPHQKALAQRILKVIRLCAVEQPHKVADLTKRFTMRGLRFFRQTFQIAERLSAFWATLLPLSVQRVLAH
jgi:hypothetical protein